MCQQGVQVTFKDDLAAVSACSRAQVDDVVRSPNHIGIVFHDDNGVSSFAQLLQDTEETLRVSRMETNARFIEHVKGFRQRGPQRPRQGDPLIFAAGKRAGLTRKGEITQSGVHHESDPVIDLFDQSLPELLLEIFDRQGP